MLNKHAKYDRLAVWADIYSPGGLELAEVIANTLNISAEATVLDAGSGSGEISCFLSQEYGWNILAVDVDVREVEVARNKVRERGLDHRIQVMQGDLMQLDIADASLDGVFCQGVFEMLADDRPQALQEMKRVVRPGGVIGIGEPVLTKELPQDDAKEIYRDTGLFQEYRTLAWNVALAEQTGLSVLEAYLHPDGKRWWDEYYEPLLNEQGQSKRPERQPEIDVWQRDAGRYHGIGILVLQRA